MATLGCVPASDRYFVFGLKSQKVVIGTYNIKSILELINFGNYIPVYTTTNILYL